MKKSHLAVLAAAATLFSLPAKAQKPPETGFYIGGALGQATQQDTCVRIAGPGASCDDSSTALKILGGYQINRYVAGELGYAELGKAKASAGGVQDEIKARAWDVTAVGQYPIVDRFSVYGRLGLYFADTKENTNVAGNSTHSNNDLTYGIGVRYDFTRNAALRGEWQHYGDVGGGNIGTTDIDVISIGALWMF